MIFLLLFLHQADRPEQAIGFKIFPEHIKRDPEAMAALLADPAVKKIVLRRGNAVAAYVSQRRALLTGQFLQVKQPGNVAVRIDPDELQRHLNNYERCYADYYRLLAGQAVHQVFYENLLGDARDSTFKGIADFLGIEARVPAPLTQTTRQTPASIINHEELAAAFLHTSYRGDFGACASPHPHPILRRNRVNFIETPQQVLGRPEKKSADLLLLHIYYVLQHCS